MYTTFKQHLANQLDEIRAAGLFKGERVITSPQRARVGVADRDGVLNLCANNYLGLANHPAVIAAAHEALDRWGYGMASVRFICGTQQLHKQLEAAALPSSSAPRTRSSTPPASTPTAGCSRRSSGRKTPIISDELNHASIIDGVRLCKAQRFRYRNNDMADLEAQLKQAAAARFRLIATDGVFSMDGIIANLPGICDLADKYDALVMVDDSHAVGFMGKHGRGTHEHHGVMDRDRHPHRHAGQGPGRRERRLHQRPQGDHRPAAAAQPAVPVLEHACRRRSSARR